MPQMRLDTYLRSHFPAVSRVTIQRLIELGHITVNQKPVKPTHHPAAGEQISVYWPEPKPSHTQPEAIPLAILFEDSDLLVVNKPAGLVVHPGAGHDEHTLVNALLHHCAGNLSGIGGVARPGIVHRLDKDTSGCLVVAKNDATHLALSTQFAERSLEKVYHALLCGGALSDAGDIRAPIARHPTQRKRMAVRDQGRDALTSFRVIERFRYATLVEVQIHTGRTHQIRVHFQYVGAPLVGDPIYAKRHNLRLQELTGYQAPRQMLHASRLKFRHPTLNKVMEYRAPWPQDFEEARRVLSSSTALEPNAHSTGPIGAGSEPIKHDDVTDAGDDFDGEDDDE